MPDQQPIDNLLEEVIVGSHLKLVMDVIAHDDHHDGYSEEDIRFRTDAILRAAALDGLELTEAEAALVLVLFSIDLDASEEVLSSVTPSP